MQQLILQFDFQPRFKFLDGEQSFNLLLMFMVDVMVGGIDVGDVGLREEDVAGSALSDGFVQHALDFNFDGIEGEVLETAVVHVAHDGQEGFDLAVVDLVLLEEVGLQPRALDFAGESAEEPLHHLFEGGGVVDGGMDGLDLLLLNFVVLVGEAELGFVVGEVEVADGGAENLAHGEIGVKLVQVFHFGDESRGDAEVPVHELLELPQISVDVIPKQPHAPLAAALPLEDLELHDHPEAAVGDVVGGGEGGGGRSLGGFLHEQDLMLARTQLLQPAVLQQPHPDPAAVASPALAHLHHELPLLYLQYAPLIQSSPLSVAQHRSRTQRELLRQLPHQTLQHPPTRAQRRFFNLSKYQIIDY